MKVQQTLLLAVFVCAVGALPAAATQLHEPDYTCVDDQISAGGETLDATICFGLGEASWADELIDHLEGSPYPCPKPGLGAPTRALGRKDNRPAWLGHGGVIELAFQDNSIVDQAGPDLWIYEFGGIKESFFVSVATDDGPWLEVGRTEGGRVAIDLATSEATRLGTFQRLRLQDTNSSIPDSNCEKDAGAELDAVGAGICSIQFDPGQLALFDVNESALSPNARARLAPVAELLQNTERVDVLVIGFADADGSEEQNLQLSQARADAVRDFLVESVGASANEFSFNTDGGGELGTVEDDPETKRGNRRVEIERG